MSDDCEVAEDLLAAASDQPFTSSSRWSTRSDTVRVIQDVEARTQGQLRLSAGTLYRSIAPPGGAGPDHRGDQAADAGRRSAPRRYYRLTPLRSRRRHAPRWGDCRSSCGCARARGLKPEAV